MQVFNSVAREDSLLEKGGFHLSVTSLVIKMLAHGVGYSDSWLPCPHLVWRVFKPAFLTAQTIALITTIRWAYLKLVYGTPLEDPLDSQEWKICEAWKSVGYKNYSLLW